VSAATRDVLIVTEGLHPAAGAAVPALLDALAQNLPALGSTLRERAMLTAAAPRLDFAVTRTP
jgi:DNA/RNA-binding domain of Phe-tRNA-synthetase-like protein